jgi:hypothetical protein
MVINECMTSVFLRFGLADKYIRMTRCRVTNECTFTECKIHAHQYALFKHDLKSIGTREALRTLNQSLFRRNAYLLETTYQVVPGTMYQVLRYWFTLVLLIVYDALRFLKAKGVYVVTHHLIGCFNLGWTVM